MRNLNREQHINRRSLQTDEEKENERVRSKIIMRNLRRDRNNRRTKAKFIMTTSFDEFTENIESHYCGLLEFKCRYCDAKFWNNEKLSSSTKTCKKFSICCAQGKISLPNIPTKPDFLIDWFTTNSRQAQFFRKNIRKLNCAFSMSSVGVDQQTFTGPGPYIFKICGVLHHRIGQLGHSVDQAPKFAQIYIYDTDEQQKIRSNLNGLNSKIGIEIIRILQDWLQGNNILVQNFKTAYEKTIDENIPEVKLLMRADVKPFDAHVRSYNLPTASEVAIIIPGTEQSIKHRDIVLTTREGPLRHIHEHTCYV